MRAPLACPELLQRVAGMAGRFARFPPSSLIWNGFVFSGRERGEERRRWSLTLSAPSSLPHWTDGILPPGLREEERQAKLATGDRVRRNYDRTYFIKETLVAYFLGYDLFRPQRVNFTV